MSAAKEAEEPRKGDRLTRNDDGRVGRELRDVEDGRAVFAGGEGRVELDVSHAHYERRPGGSV